MPLGGAVTVMLPEPVVKASSTARWAMFREWVTEEGFISMTLLMLAAFGVVTRRLPP